MLLRETQIEPLNELISLAHTVYRQDRQDARIRFLHIVFAEELYRPLINGEINTAEISCRTLNTCFEMGDADEVITGLMHAAKKDVFLMRGIRDADIRMLENWQTIYNRTIEAHAISLELEASDDNRTTRLKADRRDLDRIVATHIDLLRDLPTSVGSLNINTVFSYSLFDWQGEKLGEEEAAPIQIDYVHLHRNSYLTIYLHNTENNETYHCRYHPDIQIINNIKQYPVYETKNRTPF